MQFAGDVSPRSGCRHTANRVAGSRERAAEVPLPRRKLYTLGEAGPVSLIGRDRELRAVAAPLDRLPAGSGGRALRATVLRIEAAAQLAGAHLRASLRTGRLMR